MLLLISLIIKLYCLQCLFSLGLLFASAFLNCKIYDSKKHLLHTFMPWYIPLTVFKYVKSI